MCRSRARRSPAPTTWRRSLPGRPPAAGLLLAGLLAGSLAAPPAGAQDAHGRQVRLTAAGPDVQLALPKRPLPRYNGPHHASSEPGELLVWIPRVVFYPVYRLLEMTIRYPVEQLTSWVEKHRLQNWVKAIFLWDSERGGLFPTFYYEFGLDPSLGFYLFANDLLAPGHQLTLHGGFWTDDWLSLMLINRLRLFREGQGALELRALYLRRPDMPFNGIGPDTVQDAETFYRVSRAGLELRFWSVLWHLNRLYLRGSFRRLDYAEGARPSIATRFAIAGPQAPAGFSGYQLLSGVLGLALDSRKPRRALIAGSGVRLDLFLSGHLDPGQLERNFVRWGGELAGFWDTSGANHVLGLRAYVAFAEQTGGAAIPFDELITLGGQERMRGFYEGRFRGQSALVLTADYRYPIWAFLDANLFFSLGNVFDRHLAGLSPEKLFGSWGLGVRSNSSREVSFDVLLGFGSSRLDAPSFALEEVHFAVGVNHGF